MPTRRSTARVESSQMPSDYHSDKEANSMVVRWSMLLLPLPAITTGRDTDSRDERPGHERTCICFIWTLDVGHLRSSTNTQSDLHEGKVQSTCLWPNYAPLARTRIPSKGLPSLTLSLQYCRLLTYSLCISRVAAATDCYLPPIAFYIRGYSSKFFISYTHIYVMLPL
jgi:hypothetical protein